jgi:hypothetical protein
MQKTQSKIKTKKQKYLTSSTQFSSKVLPPELFTRIVFTLKSVILLMDKTLEIIYRSDSFLFNILYVTGIFSGTVNSCYGNEANRGRSCCQR